MALSVPFASAHGPVPFMDLFLRNAGASGLCFLQGPRASSWVSADVPVDPGVQFPGHHLSRLSDLPLLFLHGYHCGHSWHADCRVSSCSSRSFCTPLCGGSPGSWTPCPPATVTPAMLVPLRSVGRLGRALRSCPPWPAWLAHRCGSRSRSSALVKTEGSLCPASHLWALTRPGEVRPWQRLLWGA